jgi:hypothetical protein
MKIYLGFTAALFAFLTLLHIWRMIVESMTPAKDPWLFVITVVSAALFAWALRLLLATRKSGSTT